MRIRRLRLLIAMVAALSTQLALGVGDAHAYRAQGTPWPGGTITYWSTLPSSYDWSVRAAARAWSLSGARVRFVRAPSQRSARLVIRSTRPPGVPDPGGASAYASQTGYVRGRTAYVIIGSQRPLSVPSQAEDTVRLMAHEFGHVAGLGHSDPGPPACAIMKTYLNECQRADPGIGSWYCRMLFRDDVAGIVRLYGLRRPAPRAASYCPILPAPRALTNLTISGGTAETPVTITWAEPDLRSTERIAVEAHDVACADVTEKTRVDYWFLGSNAASFADATAAQRAPGTWCYTVRSVNAVGLGTPLVKLVRELSLAPPTIGALVEDPDESVDYSVSASLSSRASLDVRRAPSGACAVTVDAGEPVSTTADYQTGTWKLIDVPAGSWCLSFFATAYSRTAPNNLAGSAAVTRDIVHVD